MILWPSPCRDLMVIGCLCLGRWANYRLPHVRRTWANTKPIRNGYGIGRAILNESCSSPLSQNSLNYLSWNAITWDPITHPKSFLHKAMIARNKTTKNPRQWHLPVNSRNYSKILYMIKIKRSKLPSIEFWCNLASPNSNFANWWVHGDDIEWRIGDTSGDFFLVRSRVLLSEVCYNW